MEWGVHCRKAHWESTWMGSILDPIKALSGCGGRGEAPHIGCVCHSQQPTKLRGQENIPRQGPMSNFQKSHCEGVHLRTVTLRPQSPYHLTQSTWTAAAEVTPMWHSGVLSSKGSSLGASRLAWMGYQSSDLYTLLCR